MFDQIVHSTMHYTTVLGYSSQVIPLKPDYSYTYFHIDVTFEMRTVHYQNAFIQLMISTQDSVSFKSKWKRGQEDKIAERPRESEGERE